MRQQRGGDGRSPHALIRQRSPNECRKSPLEPLDLYRPAAELVVLHDTDVEVPRRLDAIHRQLEQRTGVPGGFIESDLVDPRYFSASNIKNRVESYLQMLEQRRRAAAV